LMKTLLQCAKILEYARSKKVPVRFHGKKKDEASHYCGRCELEVFNILFIREQEKRHVVHCVDCAKKQSANTLEGFICLEEYKMRDLMDLYNGFVLHKIPTATIQNSSTSNNIAGVISSVASHHSPPAAGTGPAAAAVPATTPPPQQLTNRITASQV